MAVDWSDKVIRDFRKRILVDANSPILAFKANRARFRQKNCAGMPYLGSVNSEDALTWNVFRSLQKVQRLNVIAKWFQVEIGKPEAMLVWCLSPKPNPNNARLQWLLGDLLGSADGVISGQMSELAVVIQGSSGIVVVECKLGQPGKPITHLWEGSSPQRVTERLCRYREDLPSLTSKGVTELDVMPVYQMARLAYYAIRLGQAYGVPSSVVTVGNENNWTLPMHMWQKSPAQLWDLFLDLMGDVVVDCKSTTWQALPPDMEAEGLGRLPKYLSEHSCLFPQHKVR